MESIICLIICVFTIILLKFIFKINLKKVKEIEKNEQAEKITNKFPENADIAEEMLEMLNNKNVKIEECKDTKTSLYIAITNKILIADLKSNYGRIQTIAHECIHSCQDKTLLMFNFIFSNFAIVYFLIITLFTLFNKIKYTSLQLFILLLILFVQFSVRAFLEIDAMTKSKYLSKEYIERKQLCSSEEITDLIENYEKINKIGIPFIIDNLLTNSILKIIIYLIAIII